MPASDPAPPDLSAAVKAAARRALSEGATQAELAAAAGMTRPQLSAWLSGRKTVTLDTAARLVAAMGLRAELVPEHD